ncbi:MAG: TRAP transporter permease [Bacillota bacterium]
MASIFEAQIFQIGNRRQLKGNWRILVTVLGLALTLYEIWTALFIKLDPWLHRAVFLTFVLVLNFIVVTFSQKSRDMNRPSWWNVLMAGLSASAGVYFVMNVDRFLTRWPQVDDLTAPDVFFGLVVFLLVLEVTRRTVGIPLLCIVLFFLVYTFIGEYLPAGFSHRGMSLERFVDQVVYTLDGVYGTPIGVTATMVYMFVLFGAILEKSGGSDFFFKLAAAAAGKTVGGPAKIAVVSSALYGSISGSPTSNVVTTGAFTIPLMKRIGYPPVFAGAVESAASTGGGILPPVMGSAAFLMVEFTGISYVAVIAAAAIPGILYYLGILFQVHFRALSTGMQPMKGEDIDPVGTVLKKNWQFLLPFIVLIWLLARGYTPTFAGAMVSFLTIAVSWLRKDTRMGPRKILEAFEDAALSILTVANACAAAGLVIAGIMLTGLGDKFTSMIFRAAGEVKVVVLFFTAVVCIVLGMGMPVPSAYVLTAALAGPALVQLGLPLMQSHLFIVYYATLSAITPPVAVAAYAAAGLARANPNEIGFQAMRLAFVGFIIPFIFSYEPALLLDGSISQIIQACTTAILGVLALAASMEGWFIKGIAWWGRTCLMLAGLTMIYPGLISDLIGFALAVLVLGPQLWAHLAAGSRESGIIRADNNGPSTPGAG